MRLRTISALSIAGIMSVGFVADGFAQSMMGATPLEPDPAIANMSNEELVAARKNTMRSNAGTMGTAADLTGAEAVTAATTLLTNFTNLPALFREGSSVGDSRALPVIWERWEDFSAILMEGQTNAAAALAAANAGDVDAYKAAIGAIGGLCGNCHGQFRGP